MNEDVCSSILVDLKRTGPGTGDVERPLFNAISCVTKWNAGSLELVIRWVVGEGREGAGKSKRDVPLVWLPKGSRAASVFHIHDNIILIYHQPSSLPLDASNVL